MTETLSWFDSFSELDCEDLERFQAFTHPRSNSCLKLHGKVTADQAADTSWPKRRKSLKNIQQRWKHFYSKSNQTGLRGFSFCVFLRLLSFKSLRT